MINVTTTEFCLVNTIPAATLISSLRDFMGFTIHVKGFFGMLSNNFGGLICENFPLGKTLW